MAARAASAGSDVAEISFRVGDSLLDDSDEQVGAGGAAVRARPSRRSKRDALSAIAIAASVGRGAGRSSEPGVSSDGVVPRKATGKSKHGGRGKSGGRQPVRPESSSSGASGLLPGVGSVAPVIQPASGDLTEPVVLPLPISGGDGDAGQVFPPFGDGSARSEERVFRESPQPSTSWGAGSWGTSPGEPYGAPYGAFPWGPGQQGWCTGQQGWSPGMFSPYFGGGFVPGWSGGPLPSGVGGAGWGAPGGGFPGSVPGCGFSSQSPLVVPETRWSATGGVTGPSSGSVGAAFDRRRSEGAPATSALVTVAVGGGAAGPSEDVVVADRGGTVVERPSVSSAEVVSSGISVPVTESSIAVSSTRAGGSCGRLGDAGAFVEPGREGVWEMLRLSVAPATWSHYSSGFRVVSTFLFSRGWVPGHVAESFLEDFVLDSGRAGVSQRVVRGRLEGFAFFCRALGWKCPSSGFVVQRLLRALGRVVLPRPDSRLPIQHGLLVRLLLVLPDLAHSSYETSLFRAAFSVAFFGALRVRELLVSAADRARGRGLLVHHVRLGVGEVHICVASSKTDQAGRGQWLVLHRVVGCVSCPVLCLSNFLSARVAVSPVLFVHANGSPLSRYQFLAVLRLAWCAVVRSLADMALTRFGSVLPPVLVPLVCRRRVSVGWVDGCPGPSAVTLDRRMRFLDLGGVRRVGSGIAGYLGGFFVSVCGTYVLCFSGAGRCKLVWIIGHSFVHWAGERSRLRPGGRHLGLGHLGVRVSWWGQRGMRWYQLLPFLAHLRDSPRRPDVLIIHLGGNDVDSLSARQLVNVIKDDLRVLFAWFPGTRVLWSDVIPRPRCLSSRRWTRGLAKFNRQVGKWVESQGGTQLLHGWVDVGCGGLYHADRVHLSDIGCDLLLDDFAVGCERVLGLC
uniref:Uncharacterized protein LOC117356450 isoform X1 n=1 Tax=Geotrypetes seraphini TaxID=260995 RepID=A0A6P8QVB6_GEOSA|nr:uncharacterized protein LOC117356450 isoform X1 [Geotrypetes seraphini]